MQDTIGEVLVAIPKPRGEGAWAWARYYLIRLRAVMSAEGSGEKCKVTGCPETVPIWTPGSHYCHIHNERLSDTQRDAVRACRPGHFKQRWAFTRSRHPRLFWRHARIVHERHAAFAEEHMRSVAEKRRA